MVINVEWAGYNKHAELTSMYKAGQMGFISLSGGEDSDADPFRKYATPAINLMRQLAR